MRNEKPELLNSWKEVASYLGRGVRTVQRWEKMGLPVRRLGNGSRAPIVAFTGDIDRWMQQARSSGLTDPAMVEQVFCKGNLRETIEQSRALREKLVLLRADQRHTMSKLMDTISKLEQSCVNASEHLFVAPDQVTASHRPHVSAASV